MSDLSYLYVAYSIIWAGAFLYMLKIHLDQKKLAKEIALLKEISHGERRAED